MKALKKTLVIPLLDDDVIVDVDFRVIEIVERVFDMSADAVILLLNDTRRVQRNKIADVITGWLAFKDLGMKRREIREHVISASPEALSVYVTSVYAALLFTLNYFDKKSPEENAKKFDELISSPEWPRVTRESEDEDSKKKPTRKKRSSASATG